MVAPPVSPPQLPPQFSRRRALALLSLALALGGILLATMLWPSGGSQAAPPCAKATIMDRALALPDANGAAHLFALVRPASAPNTALGAEAGCQALYRSDDDGTSWTAVFSATAEAPLALVPAVRSSLYLLTQALRFPLYLAGNVYRSDELGAAWTWHRVSPQDRHAVPNVAITNLYAGAEGDLVLRAANGDGAALLRSTDHGATWQPLVIPGLLAAGSVALAGGVIAVTARAYRFGASPGQVSRDGGRTWAPLGLLPHPPARADLVAGLSYLAPEEALILALLPANARPDAVPTARYRSQDGGRSWQPVTCGALPVAGCAAVDRWSRTDSARYVLYHHRLYRQLSGQAWQPLVMALPVPAPGINQILAVRNRTGDRIYLVTAAGLWQSEPGGHWRKLAPPLLPSPLPGSSAVPDASAVPA